MIQQKVHKPLFLLKLLSFCVFFLLIQRIIFLVLFYSQFHDVRFIEFVTAFIIGILADAIVSIYFLLPMWLVLLFGNVENKLIRIVALTWFSAGFFAICLLNLSDLGYYPITQKRMGAEILDMLSELPSLMSSYLKDYWYFSVLLIAFFATAFYVFKKQLNSYKNVDQKFFAKFLNIILVLGLFGSIMRGGYGIRPFMPFDIPSLVDPKLQWLASNTPFQFIFTLGNKNVKIETFFDENDAEKIIGLQKQFVSNGFKK
jgi:hypothetical protein